MASLNITDREHEERLLAVILVPRMLEACLGCATAGILLFMCIYGLTLHLETPNELRRGRRFFVVISFFILMLHGFGELPYTYYIFQLLYKTSNWKQTYLLKENLQSTWWVIATDWASRMLVWLGDGLLVYRCHIVWTGRPVVSIFPAAVYLAAVGVSIFDMVTYLSGTASWNVYATWIFLSVGVNCIVTCLISFRLLHMRRQNARLMVPVNPKLYIGVISILVESALPLAVAGVMVAGSIPSVEVPSVRLRSVTVMCNVVSSLWLNLSALAPSLIIFRVAAGRSWDQSSYKEFHLSTLAFQPHTSYSSGEMEETDATHLSNDTKKNKPVRTAVDHISGSNLDLEEGVLTSEPSNLSHVGNSIHPKMRRRSL